MPTVLIPGGAGFIGSHTVLALQAAGFDTVVFDNLSNGHRDAVTAGAFVKGDIRDAAALDTVFHEHRIDAVIHFAALIEAGVSVRDPLAFYDNNLSGTLCLLEAMRRHGVRTLVFSSTAAVYGNAGTAAITETDEKKPINPYGHSKRMVEHVLDDMARAEGLRAIALRYFNAAGADPEGRLGERHDPETHLIPLVIQAAMGQRPCIKIFGTDYDTPDGTCIRDYIQVSDLADAHVLALKRLLSRDEAGSDGCQSRSSFDAFNLGNGQGYSVRQVIDTVRSVTGQSFRTEESGRRLGDTARLVADAGRAADILGWRPRFCALEDIVRHAWAYASGRDGTGCGNGTHNSGAMS